MRRCSRRWTRSTRARARWAWAALGWERAAAAAVRDASSGSLSLLWVGKRADYRGVWAQGVVVGSGDEKSRSVETWLPRFASTGIGVRMLTVLRMERGGCFSLGLRREAHAHAPRATAGSFVAVAGQRQLHQQHKASALLGRVSVSQTLRL